MSDQPQRSQFGERTVTKRAKLLLTNLRYSWVEHVVTRTILSIYESSTAECMASGIASAEGFRPEAKLSPPQYSHHNTDNVYLSP